MTNQRRCDINPSNPCGIASLARATRSWMATRWPVLGIALVMGGCATPTLPPNVSTTGAAGSNAYIDRVSFTHAAAPSADFAKLKLCIAGTVQNNEASLRDSAGSFVGRYSGTYYQANHQQTSAGGQVFKYVDNAAATLIANGMTVAPASGAALSAEFVRYELKASLGGGNVSLLFYGVTRAQQSTGGLANTGFAPVGVWAGSRADAVYAAIEKVAGDIKGCLQ